MGNLLHIYKTGEVETSFAVKPVMKGSELPYTAETNSYASYTDVGAGETQTVGFVVVSKSDIIAPGECNVILQLYAPLV